MNTSLRKLGALVASLAVTLTLGAGAPKKGEVFPPLASAGLEGTVPDLVGKVVLVDFWASWCGPCKKSFPALQELQGKYGPEGFVVVAISLDEDKADMDGFLKKNPVPFVTLRDPKSKLAEKLDVTGIPASFLLDREGKVRYAHTGFGGDKTKEEYAAQIEKLLKPSAPAK